MARRRSTSSAAPPRCSSSVPPRASAGRSTSRDGRARVRLASRPAPRRSTACCPASSGVAARPRRPPAGRITSASRRSCERRSRTKTSSRCAPMATLAHTHCLTTRHCHAGACAQGGAQRRVRWRTAAAAILCYDASDASADVSARGRTRGTATQPADGTHVRDPGASAPADSASGTAAEPAAGTAAERADSARATARGTAAERAAAAAQPADVCLPRPGLEPRRSAPPPLHAHGGQ